MTVRDQRGSLSVEMVIIVPGLVLMLGLMIAGGRLWFARTTVAEAAYSAARAASLSRDAAQARADGEQAAADQLGTRDLDCLSRQVVVDTSAFSVPVGEPATVKSRVECRISFADVVLPGLPGSMVLQADGSSASTPTGSGEPMTRPIHQRPRRRGLRAPFSWPTQSWERGQSLSVLAVVIMAALIITAGLVIDGGQKVHAVSRAQSVAAAAARAGSDAGATDAVAGRPDAESAYAAAQAYLRSSPGVTGQVSITDGVVTVHTQVVVDTLFLSLIGYDQLTGSGSAGAELVGSGG